MNQTIFNDNHGFSSVQEGFLSIFTALAISCACAGICYSMRQREPRNNQTNQPIASIVIDREQERPSNSAESPRAIEMSVRTPAAHFLQ